MTKSDFVFSIIAAHSEKCEKKFGRKYAVLMHMKCCDHACHVASVITMVNYIVRNEHDLPWKGPGGKHI